MSCSTKFILLHHHHQLTFHNHPKPSRINLLRPKLLRIASMRAVVQRVVSASVEVEGRAVSAIGPGLLVLVGLHGTDVESDSDYICRKVLNMRLFPNDATGKSWDQNVMQKNYEVLLVSQFTLFGVLKGNKPDFHVAMPPLEAKPFYASVVDKFQKAYRTDAVKGDKCFCLIVPSASYIALDGAKHEAFLLNVTPFSNFKLVLV